jgi:hypothetical protein
MSLHSTYMSLKLREYPEFIIKNCVQYIHQYYNTPVNSIITGRLDRKISNTVQRCSHPGINTLYLLDEKL